jgi:hypothetical protein
MVYFLGLSNIHQDEYCGAFFAFVSSDRTGRRGGRSAMSAI